MSVLYETMPLTINNAGTKASKAQDAQIRVGQRMTTQNDTESKAKIPNSRCFRSNEYNWESASTSVYIGKGHATIWQENFVVQHSECNRLTNAKALV